MPARAAKTSDLEGPTGRSWAEWLDFAEREGLSALTHQEIAERFAVAGAPPWWRQMLAVAYEQHIGRRVPGEVAPGQFQTQASRTLEGDRAALLARWKAYVAGQAIGGLALAEAATISVTPKRSYWRAKLVGGIKIQAAFEPKAGGKTTLNVVADKLDSAEAAETWRGVLKALVGGFS